MKKRFLALACAVLTAVLFSSCDTGNGGGGLTDEDPFLPGGGTGTPATGGTLTVEGVADVNEGSEDALQLVKETSSNVQVSAGETVKISFVITGAGNFNLLALQSALDGYQWHQLDWQAEGIPDGKEYFYEFKSIEKDFAQIDWKITLQDPIEKGKEESIVLSDIKVEVL